MPSKWSIRVPCYSLCYWQLQRENIWALSRFQNAVEETKKSLEGSCMVYALFLSVLKLDTLALVSCFHQWLWIAPGKCSNSSYEAHVLVPWGPTLFLPAGRTLPSPWNLSESLSLPMLSFHWLYAPALASRGHSKLGWRDRRPLHCSYL